MRMYLRAKAVYSCRVATTIQSRDVGELAWWVSLRDRTVERRRVQMENCDKGWA